MSDNQTYYYMRLKESFFDSDELIVLESMENGYIYSNILLKLYLRSLKREGKLMLNDMIPYNSEVLSKVTRHDKETIEKALDIFKGLGLIEILDTGAIYMSNIQEYIGKSSTEADRKRRYRERIERDKCPDKCIDNESTNLHDNNNKVREEKELDNTLFNSLTLKDGGTLPPSAGAGGAPAFTFTECKQCAENGKVNLSQDGINAFYERMEKDGWTIKGKPVTNLLLAMRGFAKNHKKYKKIDNSHDTEEIEEKNTKPLSLEKNIEEEILDIAKEYISQRRFNENPGAKYTLIGKYVPKEEFSEEQLSFLNDIKGVFPVSFSSSLLLVDEYLGDD